MKQDLPTEIRLRKQKKRFFFFGISIELLIPVMVAVHLVTRAPSNILLTGGAIFLICVFFVLGMSLIAKGILVGARAGL